MINTLLRCFINIASAFYLYVKIDWSDLSLSLSYD